MYVMNNAAKVTYTAITTAFDPAVNQTVEVKRQTGLALRDAKKAAKFANVYRETDGLRMMLTLDGRQLLAVPASKMEGLHDRIREAKAAKPVPMTTDEHIQQREDTGDYTGS